MSVKDWFKDNIADFGGDDKKQHPVAPKNPVRIPDATPTQFIDSSSSNQGYSPTTSPIVSTGDLDKFRQHFADLIKNGNQPGNDYYELVAGKNAMGNSIPENVRYQAVFAGLSAAGLTVEIIKSSAGKYVQLCQKDMQDFQGAYDAKTNEMASLQKQIQQLDEQRAQLNQKVADIQGLEAKKNAFLQAGNEAIATIQSELDKINQYIQ